VGVGHVPIVCGELTVFEILFDPFNSDSPPSRMLYDGFSGAGAAFAVFTLFKNLATGILLASRLCLDYPMFKVFNSAKSISSLENSCSYTVAATCWRCVKVVLL
jgi:hypothetical protein